MPKDLSQEEVFDNDLDPMEAIRQIRREEGVSEEDLPSRDDVGVSDTVEILEEKGVIETDENTDADEETTLNTDTDEKQSESAENDKDSEEGAVDAANAKQDTSEDVKDSDEKDGGDDAVATKDNKEEETSSEEPERLTFKANGQDFEFTRDEILEQFSTVFGKAMNYTQKMQAIAPYRQMISALEQEGFTQEKLNQAIDAMKGNKDAIKKLLDDNEIDPYDLQEASEESRNYVPNVYGKNETQLDIEEITRSIQGDEEFKLTTHVIDDQWDDNSRRTIAQNPQMILGLHNDIRSGLYDKVAPAAMKMKVLDGNQKSDIEYYMLAGQQYAQQRDAEKEQSEKTTSNQQKVDKLNAQAQGADSEFDKASSEAERKRAASSTGARADGRKGVIDYLDDDDEAFEEWYKAKIGSSII